MYRFFCEEYEKRLKSKDEEFYSSNILLSHFVLNAKFLQSLYCQNKDCRNMISLKWV